MNNELYHHGILGQKWGVRRYQNEDGSLTPAGKKRYNTMHPDAQKYADLKKKKLSEMSNAEISAYNQRANLERQYKQLNPSVVKKTLKIMGTITGAVATTIAFDKTLKTAKDKGKDFSDKAFNVIGDWAIKDIKF